MATSVCSNSGNTALPPAFDLIDLTADTSDDGEGTDSDDDVEIGVVLKNGRFRCRELACSRKSFARRTELVRHYKSKHAPKKRHYWCGVASCVRSRGVGHRSFPRKDKLLSHVRTMHGGGSRSPRNTSGRLDQCGAETF